MGKDGGTPAQWLNLMVSEPYYLFHFLCFFSYLVIRTSPTQVLATHLAHHLLRRVMLFLSVPVLPNFFPLLTFRSPIPLQEIQTLLVFVLLVFIKVLQLRLLHMFHSLMIESPPNPLFTLDFIFLPLVASSMTLMQTLSFIIDRIKGYWMRHLDMITIYVEILHKLVHMHCFC